MLVTCSYPNMVLLLKITSTPTSPQQYHFLYWESTQFNCHPLESSIWSEKIGLFVLKDLLVFLVSGFGRWCSWSVWPLLLYHDYPAVNQFVASGAYSNDECSVHYSSDMANLQKQILQSGAIFIQTAGHVHLCPITWGGRGCCPHV